MNPKVFGQTNSGTYLISSLSPLRTTYKIWQRFDLDMEQPLKCKLKRSYRANTLTLELLNTIICWRSFRYFLFMKLFLYMVVYFSALKFIFVLLQYVSFCC